MIIDLRPDSPVPTFEQLRQQVAAAVTAGALHPGDRLPTVRQLAADLGIAPGTVQRAYQQLIEQGLLEARGRRGTRVAAVPEPSSEDHHRARLDILAHAFVAQARALVDDADAVMAAINRAWTAADGAVPPRQQVPTMRANARLGIHE